MESKIFCKGKPISSQAREIVLNVLNNLTRSQQIKGSVCLQTSKLTGVSVSTIQRIQKEGKSGDGKSVTPGRSRKKEKPVTDIDKLDCGAIRRMVHKLYKNGKRPTLLMILKEVREAGLFDGKRSSLHKVLSKIGFKWKVMDKKKQLIEKADFVAWRRQYLRKLHENDCANSPVDVVYVGESYLRMSPATKKQCKDNMPSKGGIKPKLSNDLKIVHAGSKKGFVPNVSLIFESKSSFGEYQNDMSEENFQKWFALKLLPQLNEPTIIIMDNASYHTVEIDKPPSGNHKKSEIQEWLTSHGISFDEKEIKAELLLRIKQGRNKKRFVVEHLAQEMGHQVVFLPPNHRELNPIELIWLNVKNEVNKKTAGMVEPGIVDIWNEVLMNVTEVDWKNAIKQVKKIANEYWEADLILDDCVLVDLDGSSDSDELTKSVGTQCENSDNSDIESI